MSDPPSRQSRNGDAARERPARSLGEWLVSLFGPRGEATFRESLEELIEEHEEAAEPLDADERTMFRNLLSFGSLEVKDVMVPRADIVAVPADIALDEIVRVMSEAGHSRLPELSYAFTLMVCHHIEIRRQLEDVFGLIVAKYCSQSAICVDRLSGNGHKDAFAKLVDDGTKF